MRAILRQFCLFGISGQAEIVKTSKLREIIKNATKIMQLITTLGTNNLQQFTILFAMQLENLTLFECNKLNKL